MNTDYRSVLSRYCFTSLLGQTTAIVLKDIDTHETAELGVVQGLAVPFKPFQAMIVASLYSFDFTIGATDDNWNFFGQIWSRVDLPPRVLEQIESGVKVATIAQNAVDKALRDHCGSPDEAERKEKLTAFVHEIKQAHRDARKNPIPVTGLAVLSEPVASGSIWPTGSDATVLRRARL